MYLESTLSQLSKCKSANNLNFLFILVPIIFTQHYFWTGPSCGASTLSNRIQQKIFGNYDKSKHIIKNVSNTTVKVGISIIHLDVDEKNRILVTEGWIRMKWVDKDLVWDPANFGNVSVVRVDYNKVWTPDLVLFNR